MRGALLLVAALTLGCGTAVEYEEGSDSPAAPPAECEVSSDCPTPAPESCRTVACDWTGQRTSEGLPRGCFLVEKAEGAYCYFQIAQYTCPGTCSGPESGVVCQNMTPHCGDYH